MQTDRLLVIIVYEIYVGTIIYRQKPGYLLRLCV